MEGQTPSELIQQRSKWEKEFTVIVYDLSFTYDSSLILPTTFEAVNIIDILQKRKLSL